MTKRQTAILWGRDDTLAQAMESFLKAEKTWKIKRIFIERGAAYLVEQVERNRPDVVILYSGDHAVDQSLLVQLIGNQSDLKVVAVSLENNLMQVYSKHNFILREASDLLSIIEDTYLSDQPVFKGGEPRRKRKLFDSTAIVGYEKLERR